MTGNPVYDLALSQAEDGAFIALIPALDDHGPMIWRAVIEDPHPLHQHNDADTRVRIAIEHIRVIRENEGYVIPDTEDYAEGRH